MEVQQTYIEIDTDKKSDTKTENNNLEVFIGISLLFVALFLIFRKKLKNI